jgi:glucosamine kinase
MIILGADVGGTTMRVVVYRGDLERGRVEAPSEPVRLGDGARRARELADLARPLLQREKASRADVFVVGAAGTGREAERDEFRTALEGERLAWKVVVTTDGELARAAAFGGAAGVLLTAGTGSVAFSLDEQGRPVRVGGLGWRMGDQGSAYWLGSRALEAVGAMHDRLGPLTHLAEALCAAAGVAGMAGLVRWSVKATTAEVAGLGPAVLGCADAGDPVALAIRDRAASELVRLAVAAGAGRLPVALAGGLLTRNRGLRERVTLLLETEHGATVIRRPVDPCRGALVLGQSA